MKDYRDIVDEEQKMKPRLFSYPNWNESNTVFDFEDLNEEEMLVLCVRAQYAGDNHKVFIWKGPEFDEEAAADEVITPDDFIQKVMDKYWGCANP